MSPREKNGLLNPMEVSLLGILESKGPVSLNSLADSSYCPAESIQPYINNLVSKNYIVEETLPDSSDKILHLKW